MSTVLIVDDSLFMRKLIRRIVENAGYQVAGEAENGIVCIEKYREHRPDIVTLDMTMQGMDGLQTLRELMNMDPHVKAVMISSLGQESIIKSAITMGARGFIVKPFKERHILAVLGKVAAADKK